MDELDERIVRLLQTNARQSNRELARTLGIAPSTCLERVRTLTRRGVIRGYHAEVDLAALNRDIQALVSVQMRRHSRPSYEAFRDAAKTWREVITLFVVSGDHDIVLHVAVPDSDCLHSFLVDRLATRQEVARFQSSLIFQRAHNNVLDMLGDRN
ncbi:MAG: Lrp/AsnC family transcriptional regulator [Stackebrandtia sp.]